MGILRAPLSRIVSALICGVLFVIALERLNSLHYFVEETFGALLPGIVVACLSPDSACSSEGDLHTPGLVAVALRFLVNIGLYSAIAYAIMWAANRIEQRLSKRA